MFWISQQQVCPQKKAHLSVCPRVTQLIWISVVSAAASLAPTLSTSLQAPSFCLKVSADSWVSSLSFLADTQPPSLLCASLRSHPPLQQVGPGASVLPQAALEVPRSNQQWGHMCRTGLPRAHETSSLLALVKSHSWAAAQLHSLVGD